MLDDSNQSLAYQRMRKAIIYCTYAPGQKLSTRELEDSLGFGRTPIREALVMLSVQGLVYTVPQSGTYVSKIDMQAAEDLLYIREHLEKSVVMECCARLAPKDCATLADTLADEQAAIDRHDALGFFDNDNRFHDGLYAVAGRTAIRDWLDASNTHLERFRWLRTQVVDLDWQIIHDQHIEIFGAIRSRDPEQASYVCSTHLHLMATEQPAVRAAFPTYFKE